MDVEVAAPERSTAEKPLPFNADHLDRLMDEAGLDVLVLNSKHNIQYLLGGYRFFFFDAMDAIGVSRYLPIIVYAKGRPQDAGYIGNTMEALRARPRQVLDAVGADQKLEQPDPAQLAAEHIRARPATNAHRARDGVPAGRCLPRAAGSAARCDAHGRTRAAGAAARGEDAARACAAAQASEKVVESMLAVISG